MLRNFILSIILILSFFTTQADTQAPGTVAVSISEPTGAYDSLVEELITWIGANTSLRDNRHTRPIIRMATASYMKQYWLDLTGVPYNGNIRALHVWHPSAADSEKSTIILPENFNPELIVDRKTLVHELVHYLQHRNGLDLQITKECTDTLEWDARVISRGFVRSMGFDMYFYNTDDSELKKLSESCRIKRGDPKVTPEHTI